MSRLPMSTRSLLATPSPTCPCSSIPSRMSTCLWKRPMRPRGEVSRDAVEQPWSLRSHERNVERRDLLADKFDDVTTVEHNPQSFIRDPSLQTQDSILAEVHSLGPRHLQPV